jgi:hypothetical protein
LIQSPKILLVSLIQVIQALADGPTSWRRLPVELLRCQSGEQGTAIVKNAFDLPLQIP